MPVDWNEINKALSPVKDYEDLCHRLQASLAYPFVRDAYNLTLPELADYTTRLLGGDARRRYTDYLAWLTRSMAALGQCAVLDIQDLVSRTASRHHLEAFTGQGGAAAQEVVGVLKYLLYWVIPMEKYLSGLVQSDPAMSTAIQALGTLGIRTNLQLLQQGIGATGRKALAASSGLPESVVLDLVNRADLSRLPWASKATIANIIGAGYGSLRQLASAHPEQLYADFFRYGKAIGKNLKLGNEIENSYRIAKIVPILVRPE